MKRSPLPTAATLFAVLLLALYGPIAQLPGYHDFAAVAPLWNIPRAADVLSNLGYVLAAAWGLASMWRGRARWRGTASAPATLAFLAALMLTAVGSAYYHLAPGDARLLWDRVPLAMSCAALLAAVRAETHAAATVPRDLALLLAAAVLSAFWWRLTGDLRPYVLVQGLPLLLVPLWLWLYRAPAPMRRAFAAAIALYVAAKAAELHDHALYALLGGVSGHTLKHLLSAGAATCIVGWMGKANDCGNKTFRNVNFPLN